MNTNFFIDDRELKDAQTSCNKIKDNGLRSRAAANALAAIIAKKYFGDSNVDINIESAISKIEDIIKDYEISDIYVNDNYIDVRVYFDEKELCIPKAHFDDEISPLAYMFIKFSNDLSEATVGGFLLSDMFSMDNDNSKYLKVNENALVPFEEIEYMFKECDDLFNVDDEEIFDFLDNKLEDKRGFIKKLLLSKDGRVRFQKAYQAKMVLGLVDIKESNVKESLPSKDIFEEADDFSDLITIPEQEEKIESEITNEESVYNFTTVASPKFEEEPEGNPEEEIADFANLETEIEATDAQIEAEAEKKAEEKQASSKEINTLFESEETEADTRTVETFKPKKKTNPVILILFVVVVVICGGYFGYTQFVQPQEELPNIPQENNNNVQQERPKAQQQQQEEAMPVETVEKTQVSTSQNEGNSVSIPAIEKNLDASILVSNLKVEWDVPNGYVSNTQAKRYLTKLGKIIQLNLKTELLLLSRPPISNKISIELKYNDGSKSFEVVDFVVSSGEKSIDTVIMQTVRQALNSRLNINTDSFGKLSGNPILIIRL